MAAEGSGTGEEVVARSIEEESSTAFSPVTEERSVSVRSTEERLVPRGTVMEKCPSWSTRRFR